MPITRFAMVAIAALAPLLSHAASVTYDFTVQATSGPLGGQISNGYLTYDDTIVAPGGGYVFGTKLTDLSFVWGGVAYDESTANTGILFFDATGAPLSILFGTNCSPTSCLVSATSRDWYVAATPGGMGSFIYATAGSSIHRGTVQASLRTAQVPEPASLALAVIALAGIAATRRRKS